MKLPMLMLLFFIGLWCFLAVVGYLVRFVAGRQYDDTFIQNFVGVSMDFIWKTTVIFIAITFVYVVVSLVQNP
jgi:hypothetical protein